MSLTRRRSRLAGGSCTRWRRALPWLTALALCVGCRKPPPDERVFTGNNGVRPGVTEETTSNLTPANGAGGTGGSSGGAEYGAAPALDGLDCEPIGSGQPDALTDAMLELLDGLEDPALAAATSSEPALTRVRQRVSVFRQRFEACDESWLRRAGASGVADRLQQRLTALDDALRAAPGSRDVNAAVQSLGDELEGAAITVHDLEEPSARDDRKIRRQGP